MKYCVLDKAGKEIKIAIQDKCNIVVTLTITILTSKNSNTVVVMQVPRLGTQKSRVFSRELGIKHGSCPLFYCSYSKFTKLRTEYCFCENIKLMKIR